MKPAFSVVFLTTLSGAAQGLLIALFGVELAARLGLVAATAAPPPIVLRRRRGAVGRAWRARARRFVLSPRASGARMARDRDVAHVVALA